MNRSVSSNHSVADGIGSELPAYFAKVANETIPEGLAALARKIDDSIRGPDIDALETDEPVERQGLTGHRRSSKRISE
jgi:hypothetical protein